MSEPRPLTMGQRVVIVAPRSSHVGTVGTITAINTTCTPPIYSVSFSWNGFGYRLGYSGDELQPIGPLLFALEVGNE